MTRIVYGSANAREIRALAYAAEALPTVRELLRGMKSGELKDIYKSIDTLNDIRELVEHAIVDEPPLTVREGGMIKSGYCKDLDILNGDMSGGKDFIASIEEKERQKTGIQRLKVGYNRVFGYYIEVSNASKDLVPKEYIRKQTLANCERYITEELKEMEGRVLGARDRIVKLEYELFEEIRKKVAACQSRVLRKLRCGTITHDRWSTLREKSSSKTAVTRWWKPFRTSSSFPMTYISTAAKTVSPSSPARIWRVNPPTCVRWPSLH